MADVDDRWYRTDRATGERVKTARHGKGRRWEARWRDEARKQRSRSFHKRSDAEKYLTTVQADLLRGVLVDEKAGRVTLRRYVEDQWLASARLDLRPNTVKLYESHLKNHILPRLGDRQMGRIRRADMKKFVVSIEPGLAKATVHTVYAVLQAVMASAVDDEVIPANPCTRVPLPRVGKRVLAPLSVDSIRALAAAITPRYEVTVWLAAGAGLREGEVLGLVVPKVAFLERRLYIEQQMQNRELVELKTGTSFRTVPIDDVVLDKLSAHLAHWPAGERGLVVTNRSGRPVQRNSFGHCWREAVKKAGLPKGTRFHDLRHVYASLLIAANIHPKVIQARMGHATLAETMDTYGHLFPEADETGRGALDAAFAAADVRQMCAEVTS